MKSFLLFCAASVLALPLARGQSALDIIGLPALQSQDPTLTGSGVVVDQVESAPDPFDFEVSPPAVEQSGTLFSFLSTQGEAHGFPNHVGHASGHANQVAQSFYGMGSGVATGVRHIANYETSLFFPSVIQRQLAIPAAVVNQSFEFGGHDSAQDQAYDDYIARFHTLIASGVGDGGPVLTPSDCYNGLGVGAYGGASSVGPAANGLCKPDITAPAGATSFSTPLIAGAAALLVQDASRQGANTLAAVDSRTIKALLLNGASKPGDWTHTPNSPLDKRYGAGVLNVFTSYTELQGGRQPPTLAEVTGAPGHPPLTSGAPTPVSTAWDYRGVNSGSAKAGVNHYLIATNASGALVATLVWNKPYRAASINRLGLYLYNSAGQFLASSKSAVDNLQHLYVTGLGPGTYDIEIVKFAGPPGAPGVLSTHEAYALVWDFGR